MARKAGEKGTAKRNIGEKKILVVCEKCGKEFVANTKTKPPKRCDDCRVAARWEVVGYEETSFGRVRVEKKGDRVRKILVE